MPNTQRFMIPFDDGALQRPDGNCLYLMAEPGPVIAEIGADTLFAVQPFKPLSDAMAQAGVQKAQAEQTSFDLTLLNITRNKDQTRALFADAWARTKPGGKIAISGDKTDGMERLRKDLGAFLDLDGHAAKSHGKVVWLTRQDQTPEILHDWSKGGEMTQMDGGFWTAPGMFSTGRIDDGSAHLAEAFTPELSGRVADLGAGWGYLSNRLLDVAPKVETLDLFEANADALAAAKLNVTSAKAEFHWADVPSLPKNNYDLVIMNPPFHQDRASDPDLGRRFIEASARILHKKGRLLMVANRHLAYENTLKSCFQRVEITTPSPAFKIIDARRPA